MKQLKVIEWKRIYPIKKILLVAVWLFGAFLGVAGIVVFIKDNDIESLLIGIVFGIGAIISFFSVKKYVFTTYHCVPFLNSILTKGELEELLEGEQFDSISNKDHRINTCALKLSKHWIYAKGRLFAKNLVIMGYPEVTSSLIARATTPMTFIYMTGDVVRVDLKVKLSVENMRLLKEYFWHDMGIVSKELSNKQAENVSNIFKEQYAFLKEETKLSDQELIKEILQDSKKYKLMYIEKLPPYIKKWCKAQTEK